METLTAICESLVKGEIEEDLTITTNASGDIEPPLPACDGFELFAKEVAIFMDVDAMKAFEEVGSIGDLRVDAGLWLRAFQTVLSDLDLRAINRKFWQPAMARLGQASHSILVPADGTPPKLELAGYDAAFDQRVLREFVSFLFAPTHYG